MKPKFEPTEHGIEIIDPIERHRYHLETSGGVSLEAADPDRIGFPIGSAVQCRTAAITLPRTENVLVRDSDGLMLAKVSPTEQAEFQPDEYVLDLSGPLKLYGRLEGSVRIFSDGQQTYLKFGDETEVVLGARSFHKQPAGTITTTTDVSDVMKAVSAFGSALKTTKPERAYPTLRGHPPLIELGDELRIPDDFSSTESTVRIEVPPSLEHVFRVAPLAYYLGADVVPNETPRISTGHGYTYPLAESEDIELSVKRLLKQLFFLDCIVRTEGKTPLPLHERQAIEPALPFDVADAYAKPLAERLEEYLSVPYAALEPALPDWQSETELEPTREHIRFLPFLANDLAVVTVDEDGTDRTPPAPVVEHAIEAFTRDDFVRSTRPQATRGNALETGASGSPRQPTIEQSWRGIGASELTSTTPLSAYQNDIGRTPKAGPIEIEVICNDTDMMEELENVNETYGTREGVPFDTTVNYDLSVDDLATVLERDSDFLHYIGHIDAEGFQCSDGKLHAASVDTVGANAFLLNACRSHEQGLRLIEAGSIGGIVTLGNVVNSGAVSIGSQIARLLNLGFPLYGALDIARQENVVGQQYLMVGNGETTIAQSETRVPNVCSVDETGEGTAVEITTYNSSNGRRGGVFSPHIDSVEWYYVIPRMSDRLPVSETELDAFLDEALFPVIRDDELHWSTDLLE